MADAIFIAGYYRSGTSALCGALHRLGVTMHNDAEANEHNPLGFYEIPELIELDVELFGKLGVEWSDVRSLPAGWVERVDVAPYVARLDEILRRRFGKEVLFGLKHPHLCRLLPIYEKVVRQAGHIPHVIHIVRDPWVVAASQARKNQLSRAHAVLLWASYLVDAERQARHLRRVWLNYETLLASPEVSLRRVCEGLGVAGAEAGMAEAVGTLVGALNRSRMVGFDDLAAPVRGLAADIWEAVREGELGVGVWDGFGRRRDELVGLLKELGSSGGVVLQNFGAGQRGVPRGVAEPVALRPPERWDEGAKRRLAARAVDADLPRVAVFIAAPPQRAHAIGETLASLEAQWHRPAAIRIFATDTVEILGHEVERVAADGGALTRRLCLALNEAAAAFDYVAILNAGDIISVDACQRFALSAAGGAADLIYCDEVVPADRVLWVRHKPAWDVTRLRQSAYLGDWVWYRGAALLSAGGFDAGFAGVEEYDLQLRLSEQGAAAVRLAETLFTRAKLSRRDNIPATIFGPLALAALAAHLARVGIAAAPAPRTHLGLFQHRTEVADPGTAIVLLCDYADLESVNGWAQGLLSGPELTGPIILAGAGLKPEVAAYLERVAAADVLRGKILAVRPSARLKAGEALRRAVALTSSPHIAVVDAGAAPVSAGWLAALRGRLADGAVGAVSGRSLVKLGKDGAGFMVQGPIVRGADTRLGAGHLPDDPGPGGWLAVDQEVGAVAPGGVLFRRAALAAVRADGLDGDALWIDVCAQVAAAGHKIVWTPDVSFVGRAESVRPDLLCAYRAGSPAARHLPGAEALHHPALSLRGDLLAAERRFGLLKAAPADAHDVLISGAPDVAGAVLNAARALRLAGALEAGWAPEPFLPAEIARRDAAVWVRINPSVAAPAGRYDAVFTAPPAAGGQAGLVGARHLFATSPGLVALVKKAAAGRPVGLCRPALSGRLWAGFEPASGLNTKPRVLWVDEGIAPDWLPDLMRETADRAAWIVVERPEQRYGADIARLTAPADEQGWARDLAAVAPHIMVRPAGGSVWADRYVSLLGAACGCHLLLDDRLDTPDGLGAWRLADELSVWVGRLGAALKDFPATLSLGAAARRGCLALPDVETQPPAWAGLRPAATTQAAPATAAAG